MAKRPNTEMAISVLRDIRRKREMEKVNKTSYIYLGNAIYNLYTRNYLPMRKVLILTPFYPPRIGGAEEFAKKLRDELSKVYEVDVCTLTWKSYKEWEGMNLWEGLKVIARLLPKALGMCLRKKYVSVYALGLNSTLIGVLLRALCGVKILTVLQALYTPKKGKRFLRWLLGKAEKVFVEGRTGEDNALELGAKRIVIFNNWAEKTFFPIKRKGRLKVLFVGRPIEIKGRWLIEIVEKECENIDFIYAENVPHEEMPSYYQTSDILVVPSLYEEGFPNVVPEGASCGCVVIASNRGGLPELVKPFGYVVEPLPKNFREIILMLNRDRGRLKHKRKETILYAKKHFTHRNAKVFI